jgi:hypothetical protein
MKTIRVQYDPVKNVANKKKHKVSPADAEAVFYDEVALELEDNDMTKSAGLSSAKTPLVVSSSSHIPTESRSSCASSARA